jgi:asparagine synthase (glutamine-hydrolysing)
MSRPERYALTRLELATGIVIETDRHAPPLPPAPAGISARDALADSIRVALRRPPCLVSFSGGRDSSGVLALAADIARKERLSAPVAVTFRYPDGMAGADESSWQEIVIRHARIEDWIRIEITDEMDCLGPIGTEALLRHRLIFPIAAHSLVPALRLCAGGSLVTGTGGDQILGRRSHIGDLLAGRARPVPRDAVRVAVAFGPRGVRRARLRRQAPQFVTWLTPAGRRAFETSWGKVLAAASPIWSRGLGQTWRSRDLRLALAGMNVLAEDYDVQMLHPLFSPLFVSALAAEGGVRGFANRTDVMRMLFGHVLPDEVSSRQSKAVFGQPYWTHYSQEFGRTWSGGGVDGEFVDVGALQRLWASSEPPPAPTLILLKQAWLHTHDGGHASASMSTSRDPTRSS